MKYLSWSLSLNINIYTCINIGSCMYTYTGHYHIYICIYIYMCIHVQTLYMHILDLNGIANISFIYQYWGYKQWVMKFTKKADLPNNNSFLTSRNYCFDNQKL